MKRTDEKIINSSKRKKKLELTDRKKPQSHQKETYTEKDGNFTLQNIQDINIESKKLEKIKKQEEFVYNSDYLALKRSFELLEKEAEEIDQELIKYDLEL